MNRFIIGVNEDGIHIVKNRKEVSKGIKTFDDFIAGLKKAKYKEDDIVMFSSSMDFPEEHTKDKQILDLVEEIQS